MPDAFQIDLERFGKKAGRHTLAGAHSAQEGLYGTHSRIRPAEVLGFIGDGLKPPYLAFHPHPCFF
jgi:hypothetical protein